MTTLARQNALFVSEDWLRIYEALSNVDFRAFDLDNLVQALMNYLRTNYPDQFNDWIASSEFVTKIEILAWLSQNLAFRTDLNTRENFLATAERRSSILNLANNIAFKVSRLVGAKGQVQIVSLATTQPLTDSNGVNVQNSEIIWNDPANENWFEQFILILNSAFTTRTQYGTPLARFTSGLSRIDEYVMNSRMPSSGVYTFSATVNGQAIPFEIVNTDLNSTTGLVRELAPNPLNAFRFYYMTDGKGTSSPNTGFFIPVKQGTLSFLDQNILTPVPVNTITLSTPNINNDDLFVVELDQFGDVAKIWTEVDTVFGQRVSFNTLPSATQTIYEVNTLSNDNVLIRFGDGKFGQIPTGNFRLWYRTSNPTPSIVKPENIQNQSITVPYVSNNQLFYLGIKFSLQSTIVNAAPSQTNLDIQTRANLVYYTQDRMITSPDYNSFFLVDNTIRKVKSVNRTFSGGSRYAKLHDPTGLYENVKLIGEDGRLYTLPTRRTQLLSANPDVLTISQLVNLYVHPLIRQLDKSLLYYTAYTELFLPVPTSWHQTSVLDLSARGQMIRNSLPVPVGTSAFLSDPLYYVDEDAILRYDTLTGPLVAVDHVNGTGALRDGIALRGIIPEGKTIISVMPSIRTTFTEAEISAIKTQLGLKLLFGVGWNQITQSWQVITYPNINITDPFNLTNQGIVDSTNSDQSWMFYIQFIPGTNGADDRWEIVDRGIGYYFESVKDVAFYFANNERILNDTGHNVFDNINLLPDNESKNSLHRRGINTNIANTHVVFTFLGDGTTLCFKTSQNPLLATTTVVFVNNQLQIPNVDYTFTVNTSGDSVCFVTAPPDQAAIQVQVGNSFIYPAQTVMSRAGDGVEQTLSLGVLQAIPSNIISTIDGVFQNPGRDFTMTVVGGQAAILYDAPLPMGTTAVAFTLGDVTSPVFTKLDVIGDSTTVRFDTHSPNQTYDSVIVITDGVYQTGGVDYTIDNIDPANSVIVFVRAPPTATRVVMYASTQPTLIRSRSYTFVGDGTTSVYAFLDIPKMTSHQIIATIDGIFQNGPDVVPNSYSITSNSVHFTTPPPLNTRVTFFVVLGAVVNSGASPAPLPPISYMGADAIWFVADELRHDDGYPNASGVTVEPADVNQDGVFDDPFLFTDIVLADGVTDIVIWRKLTQFGFSVWSPLAASTSPRAFYGLQSVTRIRSGASVDPTKFLDQDIYLDLTTKTFLVADLANSGNWNLVSQNDYKYAIGRDDLRFIWTHYAPDSHRIDPSVSNVMDTYILSGTFDDAYRTWLRTNGPARDEPIPPTSESLRIQYQSFDDFKSVDDAIIYHSARYRPLFGSKAIPEQQATFKVIKSIGSLLSDNDLKLRILSVIDQYFSITNWNFGDSFYFTELAGYLHQSLAPDLQSVVIVPKTSTLAFGQMFQIRSEADELLIRAATVADIDIVRNYTQQELRIGTF